MKDVGNQRWLKQVGSNESSINPLLFLPISIVVSLSNMMIFFLWFWQTSWIFWNIWVDHFLQPYHFLLTDRFHWIHVVSLCVCSIIVNLMLSIVCNTICIFIQSMFLLQWCKFVDMLVIIWAFVLIFDIELFRWDFSCFPCVHCARYVNLVAK